jgi:hypothetical protein
MLVLETAARFLLCIFLAACLTTRARRIEDLAIALAACVAAVLVELHGAGREAVVCTVLLLAGGMGIAELFATNHAQRLPAQSAHPLGAACAGLLAGQGMLLLGATFTLLVILSRLALTRLPAADASAGARTLSITAQSLHGTIGRIEAVLERLGLAPCALSVGRDDAAKELSIRMQLVLPPNLASATLMTALQDVEGVIRFGLE